MDGTVQIAGGPSPLVGRVEVCVNRTWGTVCENNWNDLDALVLCQQMGHSSNGINEIHFWDHIDTFSDCF